MKRGSVLSRDRKRTVSSAVFSKNKTYRISILQLHSRRLDAGFLKKIVRALLERVFGKTDCEVSLVFVEASEMARINQDFLGHEGSTDVITFAYNVEPLHGEIVVSLDDAISQARIFRTNWESEVIRYIVHGILHLKGYDDVKTRARHEMKQAENRILRELSTEFDIGKRALLLKPKR